MATKKSQDPPKYKIAPVHISCDGSIKKIDLHKADFVHFEFDSGCDNQDVKIFCNVIFPIRKKKRKKQHRDDYTISLSS